MRTFDNLGSQGVHKGSSVSPPLQRVVQTHHPKDAWDTDLLAPPHPPPAASFTFSLASMYVLGRMVLSHIWLTFFILLTRIRVALTKGRWTYADYMPEKVR